MKKTLITLAALAMASVASAATDATWTLSAGPSDGLVTYTTTLSGLYDINLGDAAIKDGESFTLTVNTTLNAWNNEYGTGVISTNDAYGATGSADNFTLYVGNKAEKGGKVELNINNWTYTATNVDYAKTDAPLTLAFELKYVKGDKIYLSSLDGSDVTWDTISDHNIVTTYNFTRLNNQGSNNATVYNGSETIISITKAGTLPTVPDAGQAIPEPATATLSLLALAGLAARRRRK